MKVHWEGPLRTTAKVLLEEAGYHGFVDPNTGKPSFILRLTPGRYPRMHVYVTREHPERTEFDLHLDQTQAVREGQTAHAGEYDGPQVQQEAQRLLRWLAYYGQPE